MSYNSNYIQSSSFMNQTNYQSSTSGSLVDTTSNNFGMNTAAMPSNNSSNMFPGIPQPENMSFGMITPQYSPETTVAITLRHFEKEAKSQAEGEYDNENGTLPPPPPEDDLSIDPEIRKAHKKKRKVRSAIVSRRKTAIYLEKLEVELEDRDSMNTTLNKNLALYRKVIADIESKIKGMQRSVNQRSPQSNKRTRMQGSAYQSQANKIQKRGRSPVQPSMAHNMYLQPVPEPQQVVSKLDLDTGFQFAPQNNFSHQTTQQQFPADFSTPEMHPVTPPTEELTPPPSATYNQYHNSQLEPQMKGNNDIFLGPNQSSCNDLYSSISSEEIDVLSVPQQQSNQNSLQQLLGQYQSKAKQVEGAFSECSDRNMSPSIKTNTSSFQDDSNMQTYPLPESVNSQTWRPSFQPLPLHQHQLF